MSSPWSFDPTPAAWAVVVGLVGAYLWATSRDPWRPTAGERAWFLTGSACLLITLSWPLQQLAAHWSLTALVLQRLLLLLAVPPLIVLGTPQALLSTLSRPRPIDEALRRCGRPVVAVPVVTVVAIGTASVAAVEWQASSAVGQTVLDVVLVLAGVVLWSPVLARIPGVDRPAALGQAGYLVIQSIVSSFLAVVWIFAGHALYPPYAHQHLLGLTPHTDQQLAGFVAKLGMIAVLWTVAFVILSRSQAENEETAAFSWADVERELERVERAELREAHGGLAAPGAGTGPGPEQPPGRPAGQKPPADDH